MAPDQAASRHQLSDGPDAVAWHPLTREGSSSVAAFNARLKRAKVSFQLPESPPSQPNSPGELSDLQREVIVHTDADGEVHGGYILKTQPFAIHGQLTAVGNLQLPLSEGIIDRTYGIIGVRLIADAERRRPLLFALGMGGFDEPAPRILKRFGWSLAAVPFYFSVHHPRRFFRSLQYLRQYPGGRVLGALAGGSGAGWFLLKLAQVIGTARVATVFDADTRVEVVSAFDSWADEIWERGYRSYTLVALRNTSMLNRLYPNNAARFIRLKVLRGSTAVGWAVILDTLMSHHKQFGDLRIGSIVDCFAVSGEEIRVIRTASQFLRDRNVDLIVSNQSKMAWRRALRRTGFLRGPSNYIFASSRALSRCHDPIQGLADMHLTRGDGDGPINL